MILAFEPLEKCYLIRGYSREDTLDYDGTLTITEREPGYWELLGWTTPKNASRTYHYDAMEKIEAFLTGVNPGFIALTGTLSKEKLKIQERLWRKKYRLVPIREVHKWFNGCMLDAVYVKFVRIGEENGATSVD